MFSIGFQKSVQAVLDMFKTLRKQKEQRYHITTIQLKKIVYSLHFFSQKYQKKGVFSVFTSATFSRQNMGNTPVLFHVFNLFQSLCSSRGACSNKHVEESRQCYVFTTIQFMRVLYESLKIPVI